MHYLLIYDVVENYVQRREPYRAEHLNLARQSVERQEMVLGGATDDPVDLALLVFAGDKPGAAEAFAESDPYVKNGLVKAWRVRRWNTVIGTCMPPGQSL